MSSNYRPQLDGVRAWCIIFTMLMHVPVAPPFVNGSIGVDIFFALSGWLITWLLLDEEGRGGISLGAFYIRRIFRIVPLYLLTILLYAIAAYVGTRWLGRTDDSRQYVAGLPYYLTFNVDYAPGTVGNMFGHGWTLGIEEKFYLVWPALLFLSGRRHTIASLMAIGAVAMLLALFGSAGHLLRGYAGLGAGAAGAMLVHGSSEVRRRVEADHSGIVGLTLMVVAYSASLVFPHEFAWNMAVALASVPFVASLWCNQRQVLARALAWRPFAWVGRLTYAIYLLHVLVINVVVQFATRADVPVDSPAIFFCSYLASIAAAAIVHRMVEKPLIERGRSLAARSRRVRASCRHRSDLPPVPRSR